MKGKKNLTKKPYSMIWIVVAIIILIVARNIDITELGNSSLSAKTVASILVLLIAIGAVGYIMKSNNNK